MMLKFCVYLIFISFGLLISVPSSSANFNLLISKTETERLLGLPAEVSYVKENKVNSYAVAFIVLIPVNISRLNFTWFSSNNVPVQYSISTQSDDPEALMPLDLNISSSGIVPFKRSVFQLQVICSGKKTSEVVVTITLNVTVPNSNEVSNLILKRKKVCLRKEIKTKVENANSAVWKKSQRANKVKKITDNEPINNSTGNSNIIDDENNNKALQISKNLENDQPDDAKNKLHIKVDQSVNSERKDEDEFKIDKKPDVIEENMVFIIIGSACSFLILILFAMSICYIKSKKDSQQQTISEVAAPTCHNRTQSQTLLRSERSHIASSVGSLSVGTVGNSSLRITPSVVTASTDIRTANINQQITSISIHREQINLEEILQQGTFAQIIYGTSSFGDKIEPILVKTVTDQASHTQTSMLLTEGMQLFGLSHPNVHRLKAICIDDPSRPLLIYPFISQGNLKTFLLKCNKSAADGQLTTLVTQNIVDMAIQICEAMIYLHKNRIVHKDLASRNCVVDDSLLVRVTDTALSRDLFPSDYHCLGDNENRPVKWLAIESLSRKIFTSASDVWSFGVTVWELMTLGEQPFKDVDPFEVEMYLREDYRLQQPLNCPDELYTMMRYCWAASPDDRPTFFKLEEYLQGFYKALNRFI